MMLRFAVYALALSALFAVAAWLLERAQIARQRPRRWTWICAMVVCIGAPAISYVTPQKTVRLHADPVAIQTPSAQTSVPLDSANSVTVRIEHASPWRLPELPTIDRLFQLVWIAASSALMLMYLCAALALHRRTRQWHTQEIDGVEVLRSDNLGPAVIGLWHNRIVVPAWLLQAKPGLRAIALLHEQQHIRARDSVLLRIALLVAAAMPWNVLLWWQLRRLRFAIEADCDQRVIAGGVEVSDYGDALLSIGQQQHASAFGAISLIEPISQLERRIKSMIDVRPSKPKLIASIWALCCVSVVALASQVEKPDSNALLLPLPAKDVQRTVEQRVHDRFPELFTNHLAQPASLKVILNNDLSIDYSEKKTWPTGTQMDSALPPPATPTSGFDASLLDPNEPVSVYRFLQTSSEGQPIFIHAVVRGVHKSRSPRKIRAALKEHSPELYAKAAKTGATLVALFDADGKPQEVELKPSIVGTWTQREIAAALASVGAKPSDLAVADMMGPVKTEQAPAIIFGFPLSGDAEVDANPLNPVSSYTRPIQRALAEKYFPDLTSNSVLAHELLWIALNPRGEVLSSGSSASNPEELSSQFATIAPGTEVITRQTIPAKDLFGRNMVDAQGEPVLISYLWVKPSANAATSQFSVEAKIYRDGTLLHNETATMSYGKSHSFQIEGVFRLQLTGTDLSDKEVELQAQVQVDPRTHGDLSDPWETAAQPILRTGYGQQAAIELGVQYPEAEAAVWRIELTPTRVEMP
jgi:beta-lactamase regulating signal transducer with metallopeptidase domain